MPVNVVGLRNAHYAAPGEPNPTVVAKLEGYLEQARRGEIDAVAIAVSRPNGRIATDYYMGPPAATFRMVAAATLLQSDMCAVMNDVAVESGPGDAGEPA